ncbi:LPD29 domain-containing protein [Klebsiella oxytoca]|uniref:LPD29 domain-containing protein n=1 Tax=Klebsiella oxytoca TaxID=571 RepID=UPI00254CB62C|nr:LPD29 domain-containing protein [Klebsiella oxytoca]MEC5509955.1 LPD29 domain-containing protein [Klebsiella oxytoca]
MKTLSVGQCIASAGSEYVISAVHLEDGKITYSILGLNSLTCTNLLESSLRYYGLSSRVLSRDELRDRRREVQATINQNEAGKQAITLAQVAANERITSDPDNDCLLKVSNNCGSAKTAVKNIRILLKKHFPGIKFSVRMPHYGSVYVSWDDGAPEETVYAVISRFKHGSYDGMSECYSYNNNPFNDVFGGVDYISTSRKRSDALIAEAIDMLRKEEGENFPEEVTVEAFKRGGLLFIECKYSHRGYQGAVSDIIEQIDKTKK